MTPIFLAVLAEVIHRLTAVKENLSPEIFRANVLRLVFTNDGAEVEVVKGLSIQCKSKIGVISEVIFPTEFEVGRISSDSVT